MLGVFAEGREEDRVSGVAFLRLSVCDLGFGIEEFLDGVIA